MEILPKAPTVKAGSDRFVGDAWFDVIVRGEEPSRVRVSIVRFAPGARNAWHAHAVGQTVHVTEGVGRIQSRGGEVIEIRAGDTVHTPPGEWHWHGAAPDHFMTPPRDLRGPSGRCRDRVGRPGRRRRVPRRARGASPMSGWTADELTRIGRADELRIASRRADGSLRPFITIWVVRDGRRPLRPLGLWLRQPVVPARAALGPGTDPGRRRRARRRVRGTGARRCGPDHRRLSREVRPPRPGDRRDGRLPRS